MYISKSIRFGHRSTNPFGDSTQIVCLKKFGSICSRVITIMILPLVYLIQKEIVANGWKVQHYGVYTYNMYIYIYVNIQYTDYDVEFMLADPTYVG